MQELLKALADQWSSLCSNPTFRQDYQTLILDILNNDRISKEEKSRQLQANLIGLWTLYQPPSPTGGNFAIPPGGSQTTEPSPTDLPSNEFPLEAIEASLEHLQLPANNPQDTKP